MVVIIGKECIIYFSRHCEGKRKVHDVLLKENWLEPRQRVISVIKKQHAINDYKLITVSDFDRVYFCIYILVEYSRHEEGRSPHAILLNLFLLENPVRCTYYERRTYCYKQQVVRQAHVLCILPVTNILLRQGPCMSVLLKVV